MNNDPILCSSCGTALDAAAPGGLCPRCLMAGAMVPTDSLTGTRPAPPTVEQVAAAFPNLEVLALIGAGGMGAVFRARQPKLNRLVALKVLPASLAERDPAFGERFEREGQMLARLHHPNIVAVYDSGQADEFFYLLMEHVDGVNLRQAMRACRFTPAQALAIVPRICDALQFAHDEGVLHRDIKPENILLDGKGRVKLADFGIGKMLGEVSDDAGAGTTLQSRDPTLTQAGTALGTPQYMAPEQRERPEEVDHRADVYSLGVVFYELLTGELPVGKFVPPSEKSATDPRVDAIVRQALEKERERRQRSAGEVRTQVETIAGSPPSDGPRQTAELDRTKPGQRSLPYLALFTGVCGILASLAFLALPNAPRVLLWPILVAALAAVFLAIPARRTWLGKSALITGGLNTAIWLIVAAGVSLQPLSPPTTAGRHEPTSLGGAASAELWSPPRAPGEKPNLETIRAEAAALTRQGRYEEALQRHLWDHNHALEVDPAQAGVRLSFALSQWVELGRRYPKAKQALIEVRDRSTRAFTSGEGHFDLFMEVSSINEALGQRDATYRLFNSIQARDPQLARQCYLVAEDLLVEQGDYALCENFVTDFQERFARIRAFREQTLASADRTQNESQRQHTRRSFIKDMCKLIEILVGVGRKAEAEQIHAQALAILDVPELQSAVRDAEQKVAKRRGVAAPRAGPQPVGSLRLIGVTDYKNIAVARTESLAGRPLHQVIARFSGPESSPAQIDASGLVSGPLLVPSPKELMDGESSTPWKSESQITNVASAFSFECPGECQLQFAFATEDLARSAAKQIKGALAQSILLVPGEKFVLFKVGHWKGWLETRRFQPEPGQFTFFRHPGRSPAQIPGSNWIDAAVATIPPNSRLVITGNYVLEGVSQPQHQFSTALAAARDEPGIFWFTWHSLPNPQRADDGVKETWELCIHDAATGLELHRLHPPEALRGGWKRRSWSDKVSLAPNKRFAVDLFERVNKTVPPDRRPSSFFLEMLMQPHSGSDQADGTLGDGVARDLNDAAAQGNAPAKKAALQNQAQANGK